MNHEPFLRIKEAFFFFKNYALTISLLFTIIYLPFIIFFALYAEHYLTSDAPYSAYLIPVFIQFLIDPLATAALIIMANSIVQNEHQGILQCIKRSIQVWVNFIICKFIAAFIIIPGFMLFIIPGIYFLYRFMFFIFPVVLEGKGPNEALKFSLIYTKGRAIKIMPPVLIMYSGLLLAYLYIQPVAAIPDSLMLIICFELTFAIISAIPILLMFRLYQMYPINESLH